MIRPGFFQADLFDVELRANDRVGVVSAVLDIHDLAPFLDQVGVPLDEASFWAAPESAPPLLLLTCERPRHPEQPADAAAEACLRLLGRLITERALRAPEVLDRRLQDLCGLIVSRIEGERPTPAGEA